MCHAARYQQGTAVRCKAYRGAVCVLTHLDVMKSRAMRSAATEVSAGSDSSRSASTLNAWAACMATAAHASGQGTARQGLIGTCNTLSSSALEAAQGSLQVRRATLQLIQSELSNRIPGGAALGAAILSTCRPAEERKAMGRPVRRMCGRQSVDPQPLVAGCPCCNSCAKIQA